MVRREPAVAGLFYPSNAQALRGQIRGFVDAAQVDRACAPRALVAPHAGTMYSGPVAGTAYAALEALAPEVRTVVLLGPAHRYGLRGLATSSAGVFNTPLGDVLVDGDAIDELLLLPQVREIDAAHDREHSLEVHLPFLQVVVPRARIVPLVVGVCDAADVAEALERVWVGDDCVVVVSSDLSHFLDYAHAKERDGRTSRLIERLAWRELEEGDACGLYPLRGLLQVAADRGLRASTVDVRSSGDTAGTKDRVVGYGSYLFA